MSSLSGDPRDQHRERRRKEGRERNERENPPPPPAALPGASGGRRQYEVVLDSGVQDQIDELPGNVKRAMTDRLERLKDWPEVTGVGDMWGEAHGLQRIKFWDWRAIFQVDENQKKITVKKIDHRSTSYGEFH